MTLGGKVALVTGAGQGIGHGIALALAKAGADDVPLAQQGGLRRVCLAGDVDETLAPVLQLRVEGVCIEAERLADDDGGTLGIGDVARVGVDGCRLLPDRERLTGAVVDRAAALAGTSIVSRCWVTAIAVRRSCCAPCSQAARPIATTKTKPKAKSSRRIR